MTCSQGYGNCAGPLSLTINSTNYKEPLLSKHSQCWFFPRLEDTICQHVNKFLDNETCRKTKQLHSGQTIRLFYEAADS